MARYSPEVEREKSKEFKRRDAPSGDEGRTLRVLALNCVRVNGRRLLSEKCGREELSRWGKSGTVRDAPSGVRDERFAFWR
jgi:hypothetical protein